MALKIAEQGQLVYAPIATIWENLYQMNRWSHWNTYIKRVELLETPKSEAIGRIYPHDGSPYQFRLIRVIPQEVFAFERSFRLGTKLTQSFTLIRNVEGAIITAGLSCEGRWEKQVSFLSRRKMEEHLVQQVLHLKTVSEKMHLVNTKAAETRVADSEVTLQDKVS